MINTKEIIATLKKVREEKGYSYQNIVDMVEASNKGSVSKSTVQRIFSEDSEETSFRFETTIKPIAAVLLDIDKIEETDNTDTAAMKSLLQFKSQRIEELEAETERLRALLDHEKVRYHEKADKERALFDSRIEFLKHQIDLKDERMDKLLEAVFKKDELYNELLEKTMHCHCCPNAKGE